MGVLSFRNNFRFFPTSFASFLPSIPLIAPFWAGIDLGIFGEVFYRETNDSATLQQATDLIDSLFPNFNFQPISLFIATWNRVADINNFPTEVF